MRRLRARVRSPRRVDQRPSASRLASHYGPRVDGHREQTKRSRVNIARLSDGIAALISREYKHIILAGVITRLLVSRISIACDPHARAYMDRALAPVGDDNDATLDLDQDGGSSAAVGRTLLEMSIPCLHVRDRGSLNFELEIAVCAWPQRLL
jgi:hypothetical protein